MPGRVHVMRSSESDCTEQLAVPIRTWIAEACWPKCWPVMVMVAGPEESCVGATEATSGVIDASKLNLASSPSAILWEI